MEDIRPAMQDDLQAVFELNMLSFTEAWSHQAIFDALKFGYDLDVWHTIHGGLAAYCLGQDVLDDVHIMQLAVAPTFHRRGLGLRLTRYILDKKRCKGLRHVWLEVRASNVAAQRLYSGLGFHVSGTRKNYYTPNAAGPSREDALLMRYDL